MDADEKLMALQRAYADIILGVSQEAGARVMVSDWKSVKHQHKLTVMKDECLRILLRVKHTMDSQIIESQATLLNQQKKIDELEAQLHEAEDIVSDLRDELREVQDELERVKDKNLNEPVDAYSGQMPMTNNIYSYQSSVASDTSTLYLSQFNGCGKCYNKFVCTCGARDLPSIILRGKETGLYRNGCTQRILACVNAQLKDETESKPENKLLGDIKLGGFDSFPMKRKRAVRQRKTIIPLGDKKPCLSKDGARSDETPSEICDRLSLDNDLTQTAKTCDDEKNIIEISGAKTIHEDKMDAEKVDGPLSGLELNSSESANVDRLSSRPVREREFKYTFQRKRKRQVLSKSEANVSLEAVKEKEGEENSDRKAEELRRSLSLDTARDSMRLAQIAQQLISLSESKW